ncbi:MULTISPECIES: hypothetical protein [Microbacterium]|uniref:Uncharacterized protein n=2 Tax=Microbacterium barkeri TaxID=33917 RepID=A0A9W6H4N6_9MICO|nr:MULTISPECIES: hypothetical protein [Microbacterium]MDR6876796.1 hypothetical protein [Microbacterium barkeri]GLJ62238.1 hypothetical protein GCM10017576_23680 [Microbacterium barkeri]
MSADEMAHIASIVALAASAAGGLLVLISAFVVGRTRRRTAVPRRPGGRRA